jgi:hypothetical protein
VIGCVGMNVCDYSREAEDKYGTRLGRIRAVESYLSLLFSF